jgi:hypothetical protein
MSAGRIIAAVGPASVTVIGGSAAALSVGTILVAAGAAVALGFAGYGVYRYFSGGDCPPELPSGGSPPPALPPSPKQLR